METRVQTEMFDLGLEANAFVARHPGAGAVVTFTGLVRDVDGGLEGMEIEHYPGMTLKALEAMRLQAIERFSLSGAFILHRVGLLPPDAPIMMVATAARHRGAAFEGAEFLMDYLKSRAPFWKKEATRDGRTAWVEARESDEAALSRWSRD